LIRTRAIPIFQDMKQPWYADGLQFSCTRCGKCCTGEPGYVWVTDEDLTAIAQHLGQNLDEFRAIYTRAAHRGLTLREKTNGDCIFWDHEKGCTIYEVRPPQCRTWPFWESNVRTPEDWAETKAVCPGSGKGELISAEEITQRVAVIRI
jgi:Fe-S-cluster containining protein